MTFVILALTLTTNAFGNNELDSQLSLGRKYISDDKDIRKVKEFIVNQ